MKDVGIHINPEDFAAFLALMPCDLTFPQTLREWQKIEVIPVKNRVTIRPREFSAYCIGIGQTPTFFTLSACAAYKAHS